MIRAEDILREQCRRIRQAQVDDDTNLTITEALVHALVDETNAEIERQIGAVLERVETMLATKADRTAPAPVPREPRFVVCSGGSVIAADEAHASGFASREEATQYAEIFNSGRADSGGFVRDFARGPWAFAVLDTRRGT